MKKRLLLICISLFLLVSSLVFAEGYQCSEGGGGNCFSNEDCLNQLGEDSDCTAECSDPDDCGFRYCEFNCPQEDNHSETPEEYLCSKENGDECETRADCVYEHGEGYICTATCICDQASEDPEEECNEGETRCDPTNEYQVQRCYLNPKTHKTQWYNDPNNNCKEKCIKCRKGKGDASTKFGSNLCFKSKQKICNDGAMYKCDSNCDLRWDFDCETGKCFFYDTCEPPPEPYQFLEYFHHYYGKKFLMWGTSIYFPRQEGCFSHDGNAYQFSPNINFTNALEIEFKIQDYCFELTDKNSLTLKFDDKLMKEGALSGCEISEVAIENLVITPLEENYNLFCIEGECDINLHSRSGSVLKNTTITIKKL